VNVIQELAGHKSIETTLRYMHTDRAAKRGAIDALRGSSGVEGEPLTARNEKRP
jgi:integrase